MNTKYLMMTSAILMGITGLFFIFLPEKILHYFGHNLVNMNGLFLQILGTLYFSFAILNWMAKGNLMGGIYSKPVSLGNFVHFFVGALTITKAAFAYQDIMALWTAGIIYFIFAILFGMVTFGNPIKTE